MFLKLLEHLGFNHWPTVVDWMVGTILFSYAIIFVWPWLQARIKNREKEKE